MAHDFNPNDKRNYFISNKATVWLARKLADGTEGDLLPVGNVISSGFTSEIVRFDHKTNFFGLMTRDLQIVTEKGGSISLVIDELVRQNLEFILGSSGREANQTFLLPLPEKKTIASGQAIVNGGAVINSVFKILPESGEEVYEEGPSADYEVDESTGLITIPGTSQIAEGQKVWILYDVSKTGSKYPILDQADIRCRVKVVSDGTEVGPRRFIEFPDATISLEGELALLVRDATQEATLTMALNEDAEEKFGNWYNYG